MTQTIPADRVFDKVLKGGPNQDNNFLFSADAFPQAVRADLATMVDIDFVQGGKRSNVAAQQLRPSKEKFPFGKGPTEMRVSVTELAVSLRGMMDRGIARA